MAVMMTMLIRTEGKRWDTCWAVGWGVAVFIVVGQSGLLLDEARLFFFRAVLVGSVLLVVVDVCEWSPSGTHAQKTSQKVRASKILPSNSLTACPTLVSRYFKVTTSPFSNLPAKPILRSRLHGLP